MANTLLCPFAAMGEHQIGTMMNCRECSRYSSAIGMQNAARGEVRITDPKTGGQKGQKLERFDLMPFDALEEVARCYGYGATKYADDNWLKGYSWRLSAGALLRHIARWMLGEDIDKESGCHHLAHACWHCLTLLTFTKRGLGTDDRAKAEVK